MLAPWAQLMPPLPSCAGHRYVTTAKAPATTATIPPPIHERRRRFFSFAISDQRKLMPSTRFVIKSNDMLPGNSLVRRQGCWLSKICSIRRAGLHSASGSPWKTACHPSQHLLCAAETQHAMATHHRCTSARSAPNYLANAIS